jgi:tetratricopeptide (TPR) repeat protein
LLTRAVGIARSAGYRRGEAQSLRGLGRLLIRMGRLDEAEESLAAALPIVQSMNDRLDVLNTLETVGELAAERGEPAEARAIFEGCLSGYKQLGERFGHALTLHHLGVLLGRLGESFEAVEALRESAVLWAEMELPHWAAQTREALAELTP